VQIPRDIDQPINHGPMAGAGLGFIKSREKTDGVPERDRRGKTERGAGVADIVSGVRLGRDVHK